METMKHNGIHIDVTALAKGIYNLMDEQGKAVLKFGMVDRRYTDTMRKLLAGKWEQIHRNQCAERYGDPEAMPVCKGKQKEFVDAVEKQVVLELYKVADLCV